MPGSTHAVAFAAIDLEQPVHVLARVDDERGADGLAALRGAGAARQDRHAGGGGDLGRPDGFLGRARDHDAERLDLVDRRVRRVPAAAPGVEQHFARELAAKAGCKGVERGFWHERLSSCGGRAIVWGAVAPARRGGPKCWRRLATAAFRWDGRRLIESGFPVGLPVGRSIERCCAAHLSLLCCLAACAAGASWAQDRPTEPFDRAALLARAAELAKQPHALPPRPEGEGRAPHLRSVPLDPLRSRRGDLARREPHVRDRPVVSRLHLRSPREHQSRRRRHSAARAVLRTRGSRTAPKCRASRRRGEYTGYSGFRVRAPINAPDYLDEFLVFQGASYFRAVAKGQLYGLSARGLAVRTARPEGEEFPYFTDFWIERPPEHAEQIVVHALLQSPSVVGAYSFTARPGDETIVDVEATLFPRVELTAFGIAPLTSMFLFDALEPRALRRLPQRRARLRRAADRQRPRRANVAAARESAHAAGLGVPRRQPEGLRLAAAQARVRGLPGRRSALRAAAVAVGRAAARSGGRGTSSSSRFRRRAR